MHLEQQYTWWTYISQCVYVVFAVISILTNQDKKMTQDFFFRVRRLHTPPCCRMWIMVHNTLIKLLYIQSVLL